MYRKDERIIILLTVVCLVSISLLTPIMSGHSINHVKGFDKGPSFQSVVPMKKVTFVNFDEETYLDDYSYLASVPSNVFMENGKIFSNPLLFFQEKMDIKIQKERTLDAFTGIEYFMEDWMGYSNHKLDQLQLINLNKDKINSEWDAEEYLEISGKNPFEIANKIALNEWSYSDDAVVAVIDSELKEPNNVIQNSFTKTLPSNKIKKLDTFQVEQTNRLSPVSDFFQVDEGYKVIKAEAWWDGLLIGGKMIPTGDPDLQLFCKKDDKWMQTVATAMWNIYSPAGHEITQSYVYSPGDWRISVTDFPTEGDAPRTGIPGLFEIQGSALGVLKPKVTYNIDITQYPGITFDLPDNPPYGCKNAEIKISWDDPNQCLGCILIGPSGEAIHTEIDDAETKEQSMTIKNLGSCLKDENYKISVFSLEDINRDLEVKVEYTFPQKISKETGYSLDSAANGAVLASMINSPLLFTDNKEINSETADALYKLGVENIYLIDLGNNHNKKLIDNLNEISNIEKTYIECTDIYNDIMDISQSNDVVFSTIDPWTKWYVEELKPAEETKAGLFVGPATYIAAHHGTPLLLIENHPKLASAATWHTEFWNRYVKERYEHKPPVSEMTLTGMRIYDFLGEYGFDKKGEETIITVAGQYDIGTPWDRVFPGVANSGRFFGTPIDTSVSISRNIFYPALIFENPAMKEKVTLINGSRSERKGFLGMLSPPYLNTLKINRESSEEEFDYPTLCSFVTHKYRFNERASKYYGAKYECADGKVPGFETTMQAIDGGVMEKYTGDPGQFFPDMTETEVVPFYLNKGGFDTAFSTNLDSVTSNLNKGVLLWIHASHGSQPCGGQTLFWDPDTGYNNHKLAGLIAGSKHEKNPWRGYDWYLGSTKEPDTMSMDYYGYLPFTNHNSLLLPATGMDWVLAVKPIREKLNKLIPFINPFNTDNLYDGLTGTVSFSKYPLVNKNATQIEENLENLHSVGFITSICQTSNTYLHLMMIRHGSVFQVQDPWPTSWYGAIWRQSIPRDIILGHTVGEAYSRGISHVGILYIGGGEDGPQWWWDDAENVVYFGDPDLRMYVPNNEDYGTANYWEKEDVQPIENIKELNIDGHMPFGATGYPNEKKPTSFLEENMFVIIILVIVLILVLYLGISGKRNR